MIVNFTGTDKVPPISPRDKTWQQKLHLTKLFPSHTATKIKQMLKSVVKPLHAHTFVFLLFMSHVSRMIKSRITKFSNSLLGFTFIYNGDHNNEMKC